MHFIIDRQILMKSIQEVAVAISSRAAIPILTGIKIDVSKQGITLTGSDSDISIESFIPTEEDGNVYIEDIQEGSVVLDAQYFPNIIRKLPEKKVEIQKDETLKVTIRSGQAEFNLNGQDANEYPQLPQIQTEDGFQISASLLKELIKQTVFAVSTMETRPILTGVNIKLENSTLTFTATDSHRLASRYVFLPDVSLNISSIVVPGKSLDELNKILKNSKENVDIRLTNNLISFKTKHLSFISRLLDGKYPETSRLIPKDSKTVLHINTKELIQTIDRAALLAQEEQHNVVKLSTKEQNIIEISSQSPEIGEVSEEKTVQKIEGEQLKISFSAKYMIEALRAIDSEEVTIAFTGAMRPFVIRPANDDPILQLILPVRTF